MIAEPESVTRCDDETKVVVVFDRRPTDAEIKEIHEILAGRFPRTSASIAGVVEKLRQAVVSDDEVAEPDWVIPRETLDEAIATLVRTEARWNAVLHRVFFHGIEGSFLVATENPPAKVMGSVAAAHFEKAIDRAVGRDGVAANEAKRGKR